MLDSDGSLLGLYLYQLPIRQRLELKNLQFLCKIVNEMASSYLQQFLELIKPTPSLLWENQEN